MLKEKTSQREFDYESPDGDMFKIIYIRTEDRQYVQIYRGVMVESDEQGQELKYDEEGQAYDAQMLLDLSDELRSISGSNAENSSDLEKPTVMDGRLGPLAIDSKVAQSMSNMGDSAPIYSLSGNVPPTPEAWKIKEGEEAEGWKKDVVERISSPQVSDPNKKVKRKGVQASDII